MERPSTSSTLRGAKGYLIDIPHGPYKEVWDLQKKLHDLRVRGEIPDVFILVEHNPVITIGRNAGFDNLKVPPEALREKGVELYKIERGGDVTYHGPGQLVGYPIFYIRQALAGIKGFIRNMEKALIKAVSHFGIEATVKEGLPGIWVGNDKLAAIGVAVKRWVTFHGFALNVNTDLSYFDLIVPCGLRDKGVTSMEKLLGRKVDMDEVKMRVREAFEEVYGISFENWNPEGLM